MRSEKLGYRLYYFNTERNFDIEPLYSYSVSWRLYAFQG